MTRPILIVFVAIAVSYLVGAAFVFNNMLAISDLSWSGFEASARYLVPPTALSILAILIVAIACAKYYIESVIELVRHRDAVPRFERHWASYETSLRQFVKKDDPTALSTIEESLSAARNAFAAAFQRVASVRFWRVGDYWYLLENTSFYYSVRGYSTPFEKYVRMLSDFVGAINRGDAPPSLISSEQVLPFCLALQKEIEKSSIRIASAQDSVSTMDVSKAYDAAVRAIWIAHANSESLSDSFGYGYSQASISGSASD